MDLLTPSVGFIFWTAIVFLILLLILSKWAWKPILSAVDNREKSIIDALNQATIARREVEKLRADHQHIIREAKLERDGILTEARNIGEKLIESAQQEAQKESEKIVTAARQAIEIEKRSAIMALKNEMGKLSIGIAEQLVHRELKDPSAQNQLVESLLEKSEF